MAQTTTCDFCEKVCKNPIAGYWDKDVLTIMKLLGDNKNITIDICPECFMAIVEKRETLGRFLGTKEE